MYLHQDIINIQMIFIFGIILIKVDVVHFIKVLKIIYVNFQQFKIVDNLFIQIINGHVNNVIMVMY